MGHTQRMLKGVVSGLLTENAEQGTYARRRKALLERRRSMIFMYATVILVVVGLLLQAGKMVGITSSNKNIRAMKAEMRVMEAHVENLESELMLELRTIVVRQRAKERLGMINPPYTELLRMDTRDTHSGEGTRVHPHNKIERIFRTSGAFGNSGCLFSVKNLEASRQIRAGRLSRLREGRINGIMEARARYEGYRSRRSNARK